MDMRGKRNSYYLFVYPNWLLCILLCVVYGSVVNLVCHFIAIWNMKFSTFLSLPPLPRLFPFFLSIHSSVSYSWHSQNYDGVGTPRSGMGETERGGEQRCRVWDLGRGGEVVKGRDRCMVLVPTPCTWSRHVDVGIGATVVYHPMWRQFPLCVCRLLLIFWIFFFFPCRNLCFISAIISTFFCYFVQKRKFG